MSSFWGLDAPPKDGGSESSGQHKELMQELERKDQEIEALQSLLASLEDKASAKAKVFTRYVEEAEKQCGDLSEQLVKLHHQNQELRAANTSLQHQLSSLDAAFADNSRRCRELAQERRLLEAKAQGLRSGCHRAQSLIQRLRTHLREPADGATDTAQRELLLEEAQAFDEVVDQLITSAVKSVSPTRARVRRVKFAMEEKLPSGMTLLDPPSPPNGSIPLPAAPPATTSSHDINNGTNSDGGAVEGILTAALGASCGGSQCSATSAGGVEDEHMGRVTDFLNGASTDAHAHTHTCGTASPLPEANTHTHTHRAHRQSSRRRHHHHVSPSPEGKVHNTSTKHTHKSSWLPSSPSPSDARDRHVNVSLGNMWRHFDREQNLADRLMQLEMAVSAKDLELGEVRDRNERLRRTVLGMQAALARCLVQKGDYDAELKEEGVDEALAHVRECLLATHVGQGPELPDELVDDLLRLAPPASRDKEALRREGDGAGSCHVV